ncbi:hypothetical protein HO133_007598 [Letharia lupina]|uniref:Uncharacterized protein n=1 Tax=Letharia lupina TaxID=560253 RepID=A0A8H6FGY0_9LECA|nr:uncharacterized protein HO133_007598 [Letharia lupina]KAF6227870.1 hypothetical protein HO133_007598 [Letharia lupina]
MNNTGQLVWNGPMVNANNLRVASFEGNSVLTYWSGSSAPDLSSIDGSSNGWGFDRLFFELDPKSGDILFRWSALEHVPVNETKLGFAGRGGFNQSVPFDCFHINSVVNIGKQFLWWQHFARPHKITETSITVSYFNNFNALDIANDTHPNNGLALQLTISPNKSSPPVVINDLSDPNDPIYLIHKVPTHFYPMAIFLWTMSYRGFKVEWQGFPTTSPDLVVDGYGKSCLAGYVSWNGATNVEEWAIYEGWAHDKLSQVSRVGYQGFETEFTVDRTCAQ